MGMSVKAKEWMTKHKTTDKPFHYGDSETMPSNYNATNDDTCNKVQDLSMW